ncbi:MAG: aminotransferase class V-fold PLP-dependent enzyme [Actinobacteria bacterium]|nr:aminotransferase class V-fold PLP-dependent enzyme [Actinomycetota bacterium]
MLAHRFTRALAGDGHHMAAHSHHLWPDVTADAHEQYWRDSAALADDKWVHVLGTVLPEAQRHIAGHLGLPDPGTIAFAPNTHEFIVRIASALPHGFTLLTTDAEFHSMNRQATRWQEAGIATVHTVPAEPFGNFTERWSEAARAVQPDLMFVSHVFFNSGYINSDLSGLVDAAPTPETIVVIDGYHGFMALPTDLGPVAERAFYLAGGYKYAMAGEGVCFLHSPPGFINRPVMTGWYAGFGSLGDAQVGVPYAADGSRMAGSTFDPSGLYRLNAVMRMLAEEGVDVVAMQVHAERLQHHFVAGLDSVETSLHLSQVTPMWPGPRGRFITFVHPDAQRLCSTYRDRGLITDARDDRLRFGFSVYQDTAHIDKTLELMDGVV